MKILPRQKGLSVIAIFLSIFLSSCGFKSGIFNQKIAAQLENVSECRDVEDQFWGAFHDAALRKESPSSWRDLKQEIQKLPKNSQFLMKQIELLEKQVGDSVWSKSPEDQARIWSEFRLQIAKDPSLEKVQTKLSKNFQSRGEEAPAECQPQEKPPESPREPSEFGGRLVMATAYQSCEALRLSPLNFESPSVEGLRDHGKGSNPQNGGRLITIANLSKVQLTHPYLRIQNHHRECQNVEAQPPIYDYGGKPGYDSALSKTISLFKNGGSGGRELGIDCSAVVTTSLGVQGLRLRPDQNLTAGDLTAIGTVHLINLNKGKWSCLDFIPVGRGQSLKPGDIVTSTGHTLLIDEVGDDPFGIQRVSGFEKCEEISEDDFDFTVLQSSPNKGGVGINRYKARDYLKTTIGMRLGLVRYARAHCLASFKNKVQKPKWSGISIVRHRGTPECRGEPLRIQEESCVRSCFAANQP